MSFIHNSALAGAGGQGGAYEIEQSLRFDGSSYLSLGTGTTHTTTNYTISFWMKPCEIGTAGTGVNIFRTVGNNNTETAISNAYNWNAIGTNKLGSYWHQTNSGNNYGGGSTLAVYRDPSAWYHVVVAIDTTQSTAADRCKYFVNGVLQELDSGSLGIPIPQNYSPVFRNFAHRIGEDTNWYLAEYHFTTDGTKAATDFGEYDDNGVWRPIEYTGNYGTFGFYLTFDPTATNGIGHDHSGNGNNWTPTGFTTTGTGTDVMDDTPTTNYATLNATVGTTSNGKATLSEGNLVCTVPRLCAIDGTFGVTSGKYYWEVKATDLTNGPYGMGIFATGYGIHHGSTNYLILTNTGSLYTPGDSDNQSSGWGPTYNGSTDVIGLALDMDNHTLGFNKNGGSFTTYDFSAYTSSYNMADVTPCWKAGGNLGSSGATFNFGQRAFEYTPPTGFNALNTANLPAPDIADGSQNMMPVLWTGTGSARTQGGYNFQPDLLWIMRRDASGMSVRLHDVVRGDNGTVMYRLQTNGTNSEDTDTDVTGLTSTGFTIGNDGSDHPNILNATYVGWGWKAAQNSGSSNTDGSITSTVSANPSAGFSIVSYTGTGAGATVGHGLGVPLDMYITKNRDATVGWGVYHKDLGGNTKYLNLNDAASVNTNANIWNSTSPTSTVFSVGADGTSNGTGEDMIAYCFAEVEGYSKFGSYTGNGSSDGPFIATSFAPAWILLKRTDTTGNWILLDNRRYGYNSSVSPRELYANLSNAEADSNAADFLSNGFKLRVTFGSYNASGGTYLYMALAENPFGGSGVSPATAR